MEKRLSKFLRRKSQTPQTSITNNNSPINQPQQQACCNNPPPQPAESQRTLQKSTLMKQIRTSPSLIRRARVIRRRTTTIYCDTLKKLRDEDAVLISQILIIKLKPRSDATKFECACVANTQIEMIPSVDFAYPPFGCNACMFPPQFFYPDFLKSTVQRREDREAFQVILTNDRAERTFAFCFKFLSMPQHSSLLSVDSGIGGTLCNSITGSYSVLVFVSPYPHENLFHALATDFVNAFQRDASKLMPMCRDLLQLRLTTSDISVQLSKYLVASDTSRSTTQTGHWLRNHVSTVLEKVGIENAVIIFLSLLAERRVIITGSNVTEVSRTVQAFVRLLSPLEWPHTLIPIVPDSQMDLFSNPTPYICGLLRYNLSRISELICPPANSNADYTLLNDGITLMDIDRGMIVPPLSRPDKRIGLRPLLQHTATMGFPRGAVCDLVSSFKGCLPVWDPEKADYKLEKSVMVWYAKLFGHYRKFMGLDILTARNRKLFASAHPCAETRLFLNWFIENGILQYFLLTQTEPANSAPMGACSGLRFRFQKVLKKYAPPVTLDIEGRRRKRTKSLMWRMFTR